MADADAGQADWKIAVAMRAWPIIVGFLMLPGQALAQGTDYSAGKTPAQLFSGDCSACHKSPRGLAKNRDARSLASFLREHYTTKAASAGALAAYLVGNPSAPDDARKRHPGGDDLTIAVPEGGRSAARGRGKKPDPAEVAREAAAAEEAARAKVRAYATAGEIARPLVPEPVPAAAAPAVPPAPPPIAEAPPQPAPENSAVEAAPSAQTPAEERPAPPPS